MIQVRFLFLLYIILSEIDKHLSNAYPIEINCESIGENLDKKIKDAKKLADDSKAMLEERMKKRPLESASMIFVAGVILGVLIGSTTARRS